MGIKRETISIRLRSDLITELRQKAVSENRSLSNCVECILLDVLHHSPNDTTLAAIAEAEQGISAGTFDTSSPEAFLKSILGDEEI